MRLSVKHQPSVARASICGLALWTVLPLPFVSAQSNYTVDWYTVDCGGVMFATGGAYEVGGTTGQADARNVPFEMIGGNYSATGGFWQIGLCGACRLYADVADPRCLVELADVLFILEAYASPDPCTTHPTADIFPCMGLCSVVELADVLAVLAAYAGDYPCQHPCPP